MEHIKDVIKRSCQIGGTALSLWLLQACGTPEGISQEKYNQAIKQRDSAIHVADSLKQVIDYMSTPYDSSPRGIDR